MNLKDMKKEELELLSYTDLTEMILKESKKSMNTPSIFKKICEILEMSDDEYQSKVGDYYTSLTTDKRFIHLENAEWDLKDRHKVEIINYEEDEDEDEDDESEEVEEENDSLEEVEEADENIDDEVLDDESLNSDEDLEELTIIDDESLDEE